MKAMCGKEIHWQEERRVTNTYIAYRKEGIETVEQKKKPKEKDKDKGNE